MKIFFNNHVHTSQLCNVSSCSVQPPTPLFEFGFFPKFELPGDTTLIVEGQPRNGLCGLIFGAAYFRPEGLQLFTNTDVAHPARWITAFRWRWRLGSILVGTLIPHRQSDQFQLRHTLDNAGTVCRFDFCVDITARIADAQRFYLFLRQNPKHGEQLRLAIKNLVSDCIAAKIRERGGNPPATFHVPLAHSLLTEAAYMVEDCRIEYIK